MTCENVVEGETTEDEAGEGGREAAGAGGAERWWLAWAGGGLVGAGLACGVWALRSPVAPAREALPAASWIGLAVPILALVAAGRAARRRDPHRRRTLVGAVGVGVCAVVLARAAWSDVQGGLPRMATPLSAGALLWLTVGVVLVALAPGRAGLGDDSRFLGPWTRRQGEPDGPPRVRPATRRWRAGTGIAVGIGIVAAALVASASWALEHLLAVDATTAAPPGDAPPLAAPERVAWTWEQSGDAGAPGGVVPAGTGLAVDDGDGIVALDGATGEERWHYGRPGATVGLLDASRSGRWVVAHFWPGTASTDTPRIVALDGATGRVGLDVVAADGPNDDAGPAPGAGPAWVTDNTLAVLHPDGGFGGPLAGYALDTGARSWVWEPEDGCDYGIGRLLAAAGRDTILTSIRCGTADAALVALDDRTGDERWRVTVPGFERGLPTPLVSPSGDTVTVEEAPGAVMIATATGEELPSGRDPQAGDGDTFVVDEAVADPGLVVSHRSDNTVALIDGGAPADGGATADGGAPAAPAATVSLEGCGDAEGDASVGDALVVACTGAGFDAPPEDQRPRVHVVPWHDPDAARTIELDSVVEADPVLIVTPHVVAVAGSGGTRLAVLAPGG